MMVKLNGCIVLLKMMIYLKNTLLFSIKSPLILNFFLKTKIQSHDDKATDFEDRKVPTVDFNHTSLAVISLFSALNKDENHYLQVLSKECKHIETKEKKIRHIPENRESFSSDSYEK